MEKGKTPKVVEPVLHGKKRMRVPPPILAQVQMMSVPTFV